MRLTVNGTEHRLDADATRSLLSVLRDDLDLTGTKYGCGEGECGACTVLVDGRPARSCILPAGAVGAAEVTTIEGLGSPDALHPVQAAFLEADALQCGYCTPGMVISVVALLASHPDPSREQIIAALDGNICRCGTYGRILEAVRLASVALREASA